MAILSGKETILGIRKATAWATEIAVDKLVAFDTFNTGISYERLDGQSPNGLNQAMLEDVERGQSTITPSLTLKIRNRGNWEYLLAQFMGTAGTPTEVTGGQGDYRHRLFLTAAAPTTYFTLAIKDTSTTTLVYPTIAVSSVSVQLSSPPSVMVITFNMIADSASISSATNTTTVLNALTAPATIPVVLDQDDEFLVNLNTAGALSNSTDCVSVRTSTITYNRPLSSLTEVKCAPGNSSPVDGGQITCTWDIEEKGQSDHTILLRGEAGTFIKGSMDNQSETQIGTGLFHSFKFYMPKGKIIQEPGHDVTNPGFNPFSYTYEAVKAASTPTGMNSTMPYFELINNLTTDLFA